MNYEQDPQLTEAAQRAASAAVSPDCTADRHGSYQAHRRHGCRCPETNELVNLQRSRWETGSRGRREVRRILERQAVREDVVAVLMRGERVGPHRNSERREAWRRVVQELGDQDPHSLARRLNISLTEVRRRLREWYPGS